MNEFWFYFIFFGLPLIVVWGVYGVMQARKHRRAVKKLSQAQHNGMAEPVSLHPVIDPSLCLGCGTCVKSCPEGEILGLINRKAVLVEPSACIGHGACMTACPTNAITLVFGSEKRGVEIPVLSSDFETTVPGIYIAGELGGMGLIRNAIAQGQQAVDAIAVARKGNHSGSYDLAIVGAGPAGLAAALAARKHKLKTIILEQDSIGGTIAHYPRGKVVMTAPARLPIIGEFQFREATKEQLMAYWQKVLAKVSLNIKTGVRVDAIDPLEAGFRISTSKGTLQAHSVLLAMGRRGTPRKLDVPGEDLPKVVYRLVDPEQYAGRRVLVVGGGDSALEAAMAIAEQGHSRVILSYRSAGFSRAKPKNRQRLEAMLDECDMAQPNANIGDKRLQVMFESTVSSIAAGSVDISYQGQTLSLPNDDILVCAGGILPTPFLKKTGIHVEEKFGTL